MATFGRFPCDKLVPHLSKADCEHMSRIGVSGQGINSQTPNDNAWIGDQGPFTLRFTSTSNKPLNLVLWTWEHDDDYESSSVNVRRPKISVSLPKKGDGITVSVASGITGGFSTLNDQTTKLNNYGQVLNTWGEFTTNSGRDLAFDVSREVNMSGNTIFATSSTGCVASTSKCVFTCKDSNAISCGETGTYHIVDCSGGNPGAHTENGGTEGGCSGLGDNGRDVYVSLGNTPAADGEDFARRGLSDPVGTWVVGPPNTATADT
jgi:hypothetical protein